ncbi:MAG: serine acetyltransferase [Candidatus Zixiibacteriota bacterium]|nr:MAG: serine acetyltransferase [candidate division Zixibacteria bacterium]
MGLDTENQAVIQEDLINRLVDELCAPESYERVAHRSYHHVPMPSLEALEELMETLRALLFPGFFGLLDDFRPETLRYHVGAALDQASGMLAEQLTRGFCFDCGDGSRDGCSQCEERAREVTRTFLSRLPHIRYLLSTDVQAAYDGDPAAKSPAETIFSYPSVRFLTNFRVAHELYLLDVPFIPRILTEMAHSQTGIDVHPGAQIGERFFMDHGTGIVVGETAVVGHNVRLYQGVTLGALSFPLDEQGRPLKGIPRHPIVEDDVIIYAGATILGRVTIGRGSIIGGNVWLTQSVPPCSRIAQGRPRDPYFLEGSGI